MATVFKPLWYLKKFYKTPTYSPIATLFLWSIVQKQGKLKNRKPILQTKVQKTTNLTNRKENHGLCSRLSGLADLFKESLDYETTRKGQF